MVDEKCATIDVIETSETTENIEVVTSDTADDLLDKKHDITIEATETLSELTTSDIEIISKNCGKWHMTQLIDGERLYIRESYNCKKGDNIIIIDVTKEPWLKQLGLISEDGLVQFGDTIDALRRHFIHVRCKHHITVVNGRKYCDKCKQIIFPRNMAYLSHLTNVVLRYYKVVLGEMLVENVSNKVLLIDMELSRREESVL